MGLYSTILFVDLVARTFVETSNLIILFYFCLDIILFLPSKMLVKMEPRYFASVAVGMRPLSILTGGQMFWRMINVVVICLFGNLVGLIFFVPVINYI